MEMCFKVIEIVEREEDDRLGPDSGPVIVKRRKVNRRLGHVETGTSVLTTPYCEN